MKITKAHVATVLALVSVVWLSGCGVKTITTKITPISSTGLTAESSTVGRGVKRIQSYTKKYPVQNYKIEYKKKSRVVRRTSSKSWRPNWKAIGWFVLTWVFIEATQSNSGESSSSSTDNPPVVPQTDGDSLPQ